VLLPAWETLAKRQHAFDQLALLAQQAGLSADSLLALADSGMNGQQLISHLEELRKGVNKTPKPWERTREAAGDSRSQTKYLLRHNATLARGELQDGAGQLPRAPH